MGACVSNGSRRRDLVMVVMVASFGGEGGVNFTSLGFLERPSCEVMMTDCSHIIVLLRCHMMMMKHLVQESE